MAYIDRPLELNYEEYRIAKVVPQWFYRMVLEDIVELDILRAWVNVYFHLQGMSYNRPSQVVIYNKPEYTSSPEVMMVVGIYFPYIRYEIGDYVHRLGYEEQYKCGSKHCMWEWKDWLFERYEGE